MLNENKSKISPQKRKRLYREAHALIDEAKRLLGLALIKHEQYVEKHKAPVA